MLKVFNAYLAEAWTIQKALTVALQLECKRVDYQGLITRLTVLRLRVIEELLRAWQGSSTF